MVWLLPRLPLLARLRSCSRAPLLFDLTFLLQEGPEEEEEDFFAVLKSESVREPFSQRAAETTCRCVSQLGFNSLESQDKLVQEK